MNLCANQLFPNKLNSFLEYFEHNNFRILRRVLPSLAQAFPRLSLRAVPCAGATAAVRNQHLLSTQRHGIISKTVKGNKGTGDSQHAFVKNVAHQTNLILLNNDCKYRRNSKCHMLSLFRLLT